MDPDPRVPNPWITDTIPDPDSDPALFFIDSEDADKVFFGPGGGGGLRIRA